MRLTRRVRLRVRLPILDVESSKSGFVRDISEKGLRVAGIEAEVGQVKTFVLRLQSVLGAKEAMILASCRWTDVRGCRIKYRVAGFAITHLSKRSQLDLREFISSLTQSDSVNHERGEIEKSRSDFSSITPLNPIKSNEGKKSMTKKKIHGPSVAHDVLDGLGDTALMEKYNLTAKQLESILRRLVDLGLIDPMEMYVRTTLSDSMVTKAFVEKQEAVNELR